jgi:hercynylcysteine S-oxide lyase
VPRGCAILYVPFQNQHLIRTTFPTSHGFKELPHPGGTSQPSQNPSDDPFGDLFYWAATIDMSPYLCIPSALNFRTKLGGEDAIRNYSFDLARTGGQLVAEILGTEVMDNKTKSLSQCCFTMVRLSLNFATCQSSSLATEDQSLSPEQGPAIVKWIMEKLMNEHDTWIPMKYYSGAIWVRLSAQAYLELEDFEWAAQILSGLCHQICAGNWTKS